MSSGGNVGQEKVLGVAINAGQTVDLQAYFDPVQNVYKRLPQID